MGRYDMNKGGVTAYWWCLVEGDTCGKVGPATGEGQASQHAPRATPVVQARPLLTPQGLTPRCALAWPWGHARTWSLGVTPGHTMGSDQARLPAAHCACCSSQPAMPAAAPGVSQSLHRDCRPYEACSAACGLPPPRSAVACTCLRCVHRCRITHDPFLPPPSSLLPPRACSPILLCFHLARTCAQPMGEGVLPAAAS